MPHKLKVEAVDPRLRKPALVREKESIKKLKSRINTLLHKCKIRIGVLPRHMRHKGLKGRLKFILPSDTPKQDD